MPQVFLLPLLWLFIETRDLCFKDCTLGDRMASELLSERLLFAKIVETFVCCAFLSLVKSVSFSLSV